MEMESFNKMKETKKEEDVYQCSKCGKTIEKGKNNCSDPKCDGKKLKMIKPPSPQRGLRPGFFS